MAGVAGHRRRRYVATGAIAVAGLAAISPVREALHTYPAAAVSLPPAPAGGSWRVIVTDWGYHTSIAVEQPPGWSLGPAGNERAPFVEFAWGDRRYYMMEDHSLPSLLQALLVRTATVTYVQGWSRPPTVADGARAVYEREVSSMELRDLALELEGAIVRQGDGGRAAAFPPTEGYIGRFYPGVGRYVWSHDCNHWTVARLRGAGLAGSPVGVILSGQVAGRLRGFRPAGR